MADRQLMLAVKYCGGCNPGYDRIAQVKALQEQFPEITITGPDEAQPDFVLVVCGCAARCAAHAHLTARAIKAVACSEPDFRAFAEKLAAYPKGTA